MNESPDQRIEEKVGCPDWCTEHQVKVQEPGMVMHSHFTHLWVNRLPLNPERWAHRLYLSSFTMDIDDGSGYTSSPNLVLEEFGSAIPRTVRPAEARQLIEALTRGVEAVEADYVTCPGCSTNVPSSFIVDEATDPEIGNCIDCSNRAHRARRAGVQVVPS